MEGYVGEDDDRRWSSEADATLDFELVSAFLLGADIAGVLGNQTHWAKVDAFLSDACDDASTTHTKLAEFGSTASKRLFPKRLTQLQAGLDQGRP